MYGRSPVSLTTPAGSFYLHTDGLGSVANVTSSTGATQWTYGYEPFGAVRTETEHAAGAPLTPFRLLPPLEDHSLLPRTLAADRVSTPRAVPNACSFVVTAPASLDTPRSRIDPMGGRISTSLWRSGPCDDVADRRCAYSPSRAL